MHLYIFLSNFPARPSWLGAAKRIKWDQANARNSGSYLRKEGLSLSLFLSLSLSLCGKLPIYTYTQQSCNSSPAAAVEKREKREQAEWNIRKAINGSLVSKHVLVLDVLVPHAQYGFLFIANAIKEIMVYLFPQRSNRIKNPAYA